MFQISKNKARRNYAPKVVSNIRIPQIPIPQLNSTISVSQIKLVISPRIKRIYRRRFHFAIRYENVFLYKQNHFIDMVHRNKMKLFLRTYFFLDVSSKFSGWIEDWRLSFIAHFQLYRCLIVLLNWDQWKCL